MSDAVRRGSGRRSAAHALRVASTAVLVAAALCATTIATAQADEEPIERATMIGIAPRVLKIEAIDATGRYQLGSGVIVGTGKVVTNCHVTRRAERIAVVKGGVRWVADRQSADAAHDQCLLRVPGLEGAAVPIGNAGELRQGQPVMAIGYTGGVEMQLSQGEVVALHHYGGSDIVQSTNWFNSGASGGGLFNAKGELVGVLTFRLRGGAAHYFASPADWLLNQIDDEPRYVPIGPLPGELFWERAGAAQPRFLQAASLEQGSQWSELVKLARSWERDTPRDPEAAYMLGVAYDGLEQPEDAIRAYLRSLEADPDYSRSWARLAQLYQRHGQLADAHNAMARLGALSPQLAREITEELEKP